MKSELVAETKIDGIIATNTWFQEKTLKPLKKPWKIETEDFQGNQSVKKYRNGIFMKV